MLCPRSCSLHCGVINCERGEGQGFNLSVADSDGLDVARTALLVMVSCGVMRGCSGEGIESDGHGDGPGNYLPIAKAKLPGFSHVTVNNPPPS